MVEEVHPLHIRFHKLLTANIPISTDDTLIYLVEVKEQPSIISSTNLLTFYLNLK